MSFDSFQLDPVLLRGVADLGFTQPTDIQQDAIPWGLEGRDLLACAMTGSGKTAAFGLPILERLIRLERGRTRALILSPTRELVTQTEEHLKELARHTDLTVASIFGGVAYEPQERAFKEGFDILVATPGRLLDLLRRPWASLDHLEVLVLDEADRMLDMGFIPDIRRILKYVPRERQTLLFSATLATPIVKLAGDMLSDPVTINLERRAAPAEGVRQAVYPVRHELKPALLLHLLRRHDVESALVFTRTKERADLVGEYLRRAGIEVEVIHGDRTQKHRTKVMTGFKEGRHKVLVATDVAARGIDVEDLSHVINLDVPNQPDDYIHRVGRTARAGATGDAITFVAARELAELHLIEKTIGQKLERVRLEDFDYSPTEAARQAPIPVAPAVEEVAVDPEEVAVHELQGVRDRRGEKGPDAKKAAGRRTGRSQAAPPADAGDHDEEEDETMAAHAPRRPNTGRFSDSHPEGRRPSSSGRTEERSAPTEEAARSAQGGSVAGGRVGRRDEGGAGGGRSAGGAGGHEGGGSAVDRFARLRARRTGRELPRERPEERPEPAVAGGRRGERSGERDDRGKAPSRGQEGGREQERGASEPSARGGREAGRPDRGGPDRPEPGRRDPQRREPGRRDPERRDPDPREPDRRDPDPGESERRAGGRDGRGGSDQAEAGRGGSGRVGSGRDDSGRGGSDRSGSGRGEDRPSSSSGERPRVSVRRGEVDPEVLERYAEAREYRREHGR